MGQVGCGRGYDRVVYRQHVAHWRPPDARILLGAVAGMGIWSRRAVAFAFPEQTETNRLAGTLLSIAGVIAIVAAFATLTVASPFPGALAIAPVIGTAMLIIAVPLAPTSPVAVWLSSRPMAALGRVSYAWYLWHWPILVVARRWRLGDSDLIADVSWAGVSLLLAIGTTRYIERPIRLRRTTSHLQRLHFAAAAFATIALLVALSVGVMAEDSVWPARVPRVDAVAPPAPCLVSEFGDTLTFGSCNVPPPKHASAVAIWGDSHAAAWAPAVWELGAAENVTTYQMSRSSCPPLIGTLIRRPGLVDFPCASANDAVAKWLLAHSAPRQSRDSFDTIRGVILGARWPHYIQGGSDLVRGSPLVDSRDAAPWSSPDSVRAGLERTLTFTDQAGLRVLIMLPPPEYRYRLPECAEIRGVSRCGITRAEAESYRASSARLVREVAMHHANVRVVDPIDYFCDSLQCPASVRGILATRDASHVSASAARAFAPLMHGDFDWLVEVRPPGR